MTRTRYVASCRVDYPALAADLDAQFPAAPPDPLVELAGSRSICTLENPMPANAPGRWQHPDAASDPGNDPYHDHYTCPHCKLRFSVEVAE
jgi:hypothetical protein